MSFRFNDGLYYGSYTAICEANIRRNEAHLKALGLDAESCLAAIAGTTTPKKKRASRRTAAADGVVTPTPRRISVRLQKLPPTDLGLLPKEEKVSPSPKRRKIQRKKHECVNELTEEQRTQLRGQVGGLKKMKTYLVEEENVSRVNCRDVMRQVEKLARAEGITYKRWAAGTYFYQGHGVTLSDNFSGLFAEARAFEEKHGEDLGNGTYGHDDYGTTTTRRHC